MPKRLDPVPEPIPNAVPVIPKKAVSILIQQKKTLLETQQQNEQTAVL
jgi:hypothetical protein